MENGKGKSRTFFLKLPWYPFSSKLVPAFVITVHNSQLRGANTLSESWLALASSGTARIAGEDGSDEGLLLLLARACWDFAICIVGSVGLPLHAAVKGAGAVVVGAVSRAHFCDNLREFELTFNCCFTGCLPSGSSSSSSLNGTRSRSSPGGQYEASEVELSAKVLAVEQHTNMKLMAREK